MTKNSADKKGLRESRALLLFYLFSLGFIVLAAYLFKISIIDGPELQQMAYDRQVKTIETEPRRGSILDRSGEIFAKSVAAPSLYVYPKMFDDESEREETAEYLAGVLNRDYGEILEILSSDREFAWIARKIPDEVQESIEQAGPGKLFFLSESKRFYPNGNLAAQVIGYSGMDNEGFGGIEFYYDSELAGIPGKITSVRDAAGREISYEIYNDIPSVDGSDIILTIDKNLQYIAEQELAAVLTEQSAAKGSVIIISVKTGEILAMANLPSFDPNYYNDYEDVYRRNYAINDLYEPGSTFKPVTLSAALEEDVFGLDDHFFCNGSISVGGHSIKCWKYYDPHGDQTLTQAVMNSCNPAFVEIGQGVGPEKFFKYLHAFGFGSKTGIDLPGEAAGILVPEARATALDLATMSIGQANAATALQVVNAMASIANGGRMMEPYIVKEIRNSDGEIVFSHEQTVIRQVLSEETAATVSRILEQVVSEGTGRRAAVEGFLLGGKTGTAQKIVPGGGYSDEDFIVSFSGFGPCENPELACIVVVDSPRELKTGGQVAGPVFSRIMEKSLESIGLTPDVIGTEEKKITAVPDVRGVRKENAEQGLTAAGFRAVFHGTGPETALQVPLPGEMVYEGSEVDIYLKDGTKGEITVPDVRGMSLAAAEKLLTDGGFKTGFTGSGWAVSQNPQPGETVPFASVISAEFVQDN